jgi:uridine kinase
MVEMQGDTIVIEEHHRRAADQIVDIILPAIQGTASRYTISVAGESGSGKSEIAAAIAEGLERSDVHSIILQQDDYFVYPPMSNDRERRKDISWVGPQEVKLDLMDANLKQFVDGAEAIEKPLVIYKEDRITEETMSTNNAKVAIVEGTYTSLCQNIDARVFIDRTYLDTRAHREKRSRHKSELDPFIDKVLEIEHGIISQHRKRANIIVSNEYSASEASI